MVQFQRVLVPLAMSSGDRELLGYVAMVARLGVSREIRFLHVVTPAQSAAKALTPRDLQAQMVAEVEQHFGHPFDGLATAFDVVEGPRIDCIVDHAVDARSDLIVLGHRRSRSGRRSLAQRLAMITPCSVWLVPEGSPPTIDRILAPIDFSDHSADSLSVATALARLRNLDSCEALHVFFDPSTIRYDEHIEEICGREQAVFDEFLAKVNTHGIAVEPTFVESPRVAEAILRRAGQCQKDLIVMSTRGRSRAAAILLGSATSQTMAEAPMPVLAVKHFGAHMNMLEAVRASRFWTRANPKTS